ncbi:MAG: isocitrate dehydrogenase [Thermoleophilia bacterium]|nr:isocitrate dehydrogenase [Thermoleophilia bacterium]
MTGIVETSTPPHRSQRRGPVAALVLEGDGIGPEVMAAARVVLGAVEAPVELVDAQIDRATGLPDASLLAELDRHGVLLKAPMTTPIGTGYKSPNVTLRKSLELFANVRPSRSIPGLPAPCGPIDLLIVRENLEDLYAGVEHAQTDDVFQCLKLVSRSGSAAIARTAFELAGALGRGRVTCVTKANIMKLTDGVLLDAYRTEADRRGFAHDHVLVDAAACQFVTDPKRFDVVVTSNLYGDILSDLAAGLTGGMGLAPSMNLGARHALFEPVHGSALDIAGHDRANPTAMILSAALMLEYLGDHHGAAAIRQAVDDIYERAQVRTIDLEVAGARTVGCAEFAHHVAERAAELRAAGQRTDASTNAPDIREAIGAVFAATPTAAATQRSSVGVDVFVEWDDDVDQLATLLQEAASEGALSLTLITNRGLSVWPAPTTARLVNHFRCRFLIDSSAGEPAERDVITLIDRVGARMRWMHVERLQHHDGKPAFSAAYGASA